jgi:RNA polymerase sigma factor (sigma-70 family)
MKGKDTLELEILYGEYAKELYAYGLSFCPDKQRVEDAIHDLFLDLYNHQPALMASRDRKKYLFASFRHKIYHLAKKDRVEFDFPMEKMSEPATIEDSIINEEKRRYDVSLAKEMVSNLNMHQREILYLRFVEKLSFEEISTIMSINRQSAQNLFQRAIGKLRRIFLTEKVKVNE